MSRGISVARRSVLFMAGLAFVWTFVAFPVIVTAQEDTTSTCQTAKNDAKENHGSGGYQAAGFFCGIFGFILATASDPKTPAARLVGKSPEYVSIYSNCYESVAKKQNVKSACGGWLMGTAAVIFVNTVVAASSVN